MEDRGAVNCLFSIHLYAVPTQQLWPSNPPLLHHPTKIIDFLQKQNMRSAPLQQRSLALSLCTAHCCSWCPNRCTLRYSKMSLPHSIIEGRWLSRSFTHPRLQLPDFIQCIHLNYGIIPVWKGLLDHPVQPQPNPPCPLPMSPGATSPWLWNTSRDGDPTTSLGSCANAWPNTAQQTESLYLQRLVLNTMFLWTKDNDTAKGRTKISELKNIIRGASLWVRKERSLTEVKLYLQELRTTWILASSGCKVWCPPCPKGKVKTAISRLGARGTDLIPWVWSESCHTPYQGLGKVQEITRARSTFQ